MHKQTHKRAFYTLAGCIAALALCVAASLFLLTPAPKAQDVAIPGTRGDLYATVQLPGKLARGEELPLVVLCHGFTGSRSGDGHFAPLAADLAAQGIATVRLDFPGCGKPAASICRIHSSLSHPHSIKGYHLLYLGSAKSFSNTLSLR